MGHVEKVKSSPVTNKGFTFKNFSRDGKKFCTMVRETEAKTLPRVAFSLLDCTGKGDKKLKMLKKKMNGEKRASFQKFQPCSEWSTFLKSVRAGVEGEGVPLAR